MNVERRVSLAKPKAHRWAWAGLVLLVKQESGERKDDKLSVSAVLSRIRRLLRQKFTELEYPDKRCPGGCPVTCNRASVRLQYLVYITFSLFGSSGACHAGLHRTDGRRRLIIQYHVRCCTVASASALARSISNERRAW
jgi:hypothetical protein